MKEPEIIKTIKEMIELVTTIKEQHDDNPSAINNFLEENTIEKVNKIYKKLK